MANVLLFDNQRELSFLYPHFDQVIHSPKSKRLIVAWIKGAWQALFSTKKNDTIVCWYDFQAVILYWMSRFTMQQRNIVCVNLLLKHKQTWKNRLTRMLYKKALTSKNFKATVTSKAYGEKVKQWLSYRGELTLLHDLFFENYRLPDRGNIAVEANTVFCGGSNGRDWHLMLEIAKAMPQVKFQLVMTHQGMNALKETLPQNVMLLHDIPLDAFVHEMSKASVVCNPLNTEAPAGLIVIFRAAANDKPIIATRTVTTEEYIKSGENGILVQNDVASWCNAINEMLNDREKATTMAHALHSFLSEECNEQRFIQTILGLLP